MARVLITGASSGFGKGAAVELAKRGHDEVRGCLVYPAQMTEQPTTDAAVVAES